MRILIADDERELVAGLAHFLEKAGHVVRKVTTGGLDVLPAYDKFRPDVVLLDVMMPMFDGITIFHALMSRNPAAKIVLCSGALCEDHPFIAGSGACHFLRKPFTFSEALRVLTKVGMVARAAA